MRACCRRSRTPTHRLRGRLRAVHRIPRQLTPRQPQVPQPRRPSRRVPAHSSPPARQLEHSLLSNSGMPRPALARCRPATAAQRTAAPFGRTTLPVSSARSRSRATATPSPCRSSPMGATSRSGPVRDTPSTVAGKRCFVVMVVSARRGRHCHHTLSGGPRQIPLEAMNASHRVARIQLLGAPLKCRQSVRNLAAGPAERGLPLWPAAESEQSGEARIGRVRLVAGV